MYSSSYLTFYYTSFKGQFDSNCQNYWYHPSKWPRYNIKSVIIYNNNKTFILYTLFVEMTGFIFRSRLSEDSPVSRNAVKIKKINLPFNHVKSCHTISLECWDSFLSFSLSLSVLTTTTKVKFFTIVEVIISLLVTSQVLNFLMCLVQWILKVIDVTF